MTERNSKIICSVKPINCDGLYAYLQLQDNPPDLQRREARLQINYVMPILA